MTEQIGVAGRHRDGLANFSLCQHIGAGSGTADGGTPGAPLVVHCAESIGVSQCIGRSQGLALGCRTADGDAAGWQVIGRVGNRNRQRCNAVAVILTVSTDNPKNNLPGMCCFGDLVVTRRDNHGLAGVCCAEGQNALVKIEAVIAVLLQIDLDVPRRRRGQTEAQGLTAAATTFDQRQRAITTGRHSYCIADHTQGLHHHRTGARVVERPAGIEGLQCQTQIPGDRARQQISLGHLRCCQVDRRIHRIGSAG